MCFLKENVCSSCHWLWGSAWGVSLWTAEGFLAPAFALRHLPVVLWHPQERGAGCHQNCSAVPFNFAVAVSGLLNEFAGRGGGSATEKVGLITTCGENKSSSGDIPGNSHLGYCWQTARG